MLIQKKLEYIYAPPESFYSPQTKDDLWHESLRYILITTDNVGTPYIQLEVIDCVTKDGEKNPETCALRILETVTLYSYNFPTEAASIEAIAANQLLGNYAENLLWETLLRLGTIQELQKKYFPLYYARCVRNFEEVTN